MAQLVYNEQGLLLCTEEMKQEYMTYQEERTNMFRRITMEVVHFQMEVHLQAKMDQVQNMQQHTLEQVQVQVLHINQEMQLMKQADGMVLMLTL